MTQITLPFRPQPGDLEDVTQIIADLDAIINVVNGGLANDNIAPAAGVTVDKLAGGVFGTSLITGPGGIPQWAAAGGLPPGVILEFAAATVPAGFLLCNGQAVGRAQYQALFDLIGSTYGGGDGVNTFNVPNLKGRIAAGFDSAQAEFDALGKAGGAKTHQVTEGEMPWHWHTVNAHSHGGGWHDHGGTYGGGGHSHVPAAGADFAQADGTANTAGGTGRQSVVGRTGSTNHVGDHAHGIPGQAVIGAEAPGTDAKGGNVGHNNIQPYITVNFIIKY
jgi:microcystin-dependent protein